MNKCYTVNDPGHPLDGKTLYTGRYCGACAIVLLRKDDGNIYLLANQRGKGCENFIMKWNMPCGFMEDDESGEQCASRETFEECGIRIPPEYFTLDSVETRPEKCFNGHVTIRYITFLTEESLVNLNLGANEIGSTGGEVDEVNDRKWIPLKEYGKYDWAFHHREVIEELIDFLGLELS